MANIHRRGFLLGVGAASVAAASQESLPELHAQSSNASEAADVTRALARYIVSAKPQDVPAGVRKEAKRTLLNWVGCALGGSRHETVDNALSALADFSGPAKASILGRKERLDALNAAMING